MEKLEHAKILRADPNVHYNCAQAVLVPYAQDCGLTPEQAFRLGANFGSGMRHGSTCGAVTGALMVLGMLGRSKEDALVLLRRFKEQNTCLDCAHLLKKAADEGEPRGPHCDRMVYEAIALVEDILH